MQGRVLFERCVYGEIGWKMRSVHQEIPDTFEPGSSLLVLSSSFATEGAEVCTELLSHGDGDDRHVLCVTFTCSPDDHLVKWRRHGAVPGRAAFVNVDANGARSAFTDDRDVSATDVDATVDHVGSPENLTRLGVRTTNRLEELEDNIEDRRIVVCFDSVTELLQYVDVDQAFRFFHVVTDQLAESGALAHFHMDPQAHDDETVETITTLFDGVLSIEDDTVAE